MNLALIAGLVFIFGMPLQVKNPNACEHAAPPVGMRWVCANQNPCDCHLAPMASEEPPEGTVSKPDSPSAASCLACRIAFFVIPAYPQAARRDTKKASSQPHWFWVQTAGLRLSVFSLATRSSRMPCNRHCNNGASRPASAPRASPYPSSSNCRTVQPD